MITARMHVLWPASTQSLRSSYFVFLLWYVDIFLDLTSPKIATLLAQILQRNTALRSMLITSLWGVGTTSVTKFQYKMPKFGKKRRPVSLHGWIKFTITRWNKKDSAFRHWNLALVWHVSRGIGMHIGIYNAAIYQTISDSVRWYISRYRNRRPKILLRSGQHKNNWYLESWESWAMSGMIGSSENHV